jgi:hypothetical protein
MKRFCDLLFQELGNQITTLQEVVNEIVNKRQIRRLVVLPYDLQIKDVFQENIKHSEYLTLLNISVSQYYNRLRIS